MSPLSRLLCATSLALLGCTASYAHDKAATDRAFDALLSMPQAQPPDNKWDVDAPPDFHGSSEDDLIAWLTQQSHDGADLNAYRHYGTLLQHAVRSHMSKVARWLLAHGADPTLTLSDGEDDALSIAIKTGQWPMVETLLGTPAFRQRPPQQLIAHYLPYTYYLPNARDALPRMVKHGFAMPSGDTARCMLQNDLYRGHFDLALQLPVDNPLVTGNEATTTQPPWCTSLPLALGSFHETQFAKLSPAILQQLDAKLAVPLLPYLLPTLDTAQDVKALLALPLRKPDAMRRLMGRWAVSSDPQGSTPPFVVRKTLAQLMSSDMLAAALSSGNSLAPWLQQAAQSSTADFAYALDQVPTSALAAHPEAAVAAIYGAPGDAHQWALVLARPELRLDGDDIPRLLLRVSPQLWPQLFAHGYHVAGPHAGEPSPGAPGEGIQWLRSASALAVRTYWPLLATHVPGLADRSIPSLLHECLSVSDLDKTNELLSLGAKVQAKPFPAPRSYCTEPATYAKLLTLGVITKPDLAAPARFVYEPMRCRFTADDRWLKTLATQTIDYGETAVASIQPIDFPGQPDCAALVARGTGVQEVSIDNGDFFDGPSQENQTPCGDPSPRLEQVWLIEMSTWKRANSMRRPTACYRCVTSATDDAITSPLHLSATDAAAPWAKPRC